MSVLFIVVPLAILVAFAAVLAYAWAARRGQFDDLVTPAWRVVNEDHTPGEASSSREERAAPKTS